MTQGLVLGGKSDPATVGTVTWVSPSSSTPAHLPLNMYGAQSGATMPGECTLPGAPRFGIKNDAREGWPVPAGRAGPYFRTAATLRAVFSSHTFPKSPVPRGLRSLSFLPSSPCYRGLLSRMDLGFPHILSPECRLPRPRTEVCFPLPTLVSILALDHRHCFPLPHGGPTALARLPRVPLPRPASSALGSGCGHPRPGHPAPPGSVASPAAQPPGEAEPGSHAARPGPAGSELVPSWSLSSESVLGREDTA